MELEKKLILDEAPSYVINGKKIQPLKKVDNDNYQMHKNARDKQSALKQARINKQNDTKNKIDSENTSTDTVDDPAEKEQEFKYASTSEERLKIISNLFKQVKVNIDPSKYLTPLVWVTWFRAMKVKEILKGEKNVFMHLLMDPRAKNELLQNVQVFNLVYNAYVKNYLDETLSKNTCGENFTTLVLNASTYTSGQALEDVAKTFKVINDQIQKTDGSAGSWTEVFNLICDPQTKKLKKYSEISDSIKNDNELNSNKMSNNERAKAFAKESEIGKQNYLDKYIDPVLQDPYARKYIKNKYNGT